MYKVRRLWRKWQQRNHDQTRLDELKQRLIRLQAAAYEMRHWPEAYRKNLDVRITQLTAQIEAMENRK